MFWNFTKMCLGIGLFSFIMLDIQWALLSCRHRLQLWDIFFYLIMPFFSSSSFFLVLFLEVAFTQILTVWIDLPFFFFFLLIFSSYFYLTDFLFYFNRYFHNFIHTVHLIFYFCLHIFNFQNIFIFWLLFLKNFIFVSWLQNYSYFSEASN